MLNKPLSPAHSVLSDEQDFVSGNRTVRFILMLLAMMLLGCSFSSVLGFGNDQAVDSVAEDSPTVAVSLTPTSPPASTSTVTANATTASDQLSLDPSADDSLQDSEKEPQIGDITFALGVTETYEPINPDFFFTHGITQVHAIFDYSGMSPDDTWERVWFLNDNELTRITEPWTSPESGTFNYFVDNSGRPLPAGDWLLELYVNDELQSLAVFVIDPPEEAKVSDNGVYQLAYTKCDGDHHNIYVADTNGNHEQLIVTRGAGPSWSPGGDALFFYGEEGVDRQVRDGLEFIFDGISNGVVAVRAAPLPTTINQLSLFQNVEWKQGLARWANVSPDGNMVAFDANPGGDYRVYFLGTEQNQQFRIEIPGEQADWSPDSRRIVYRSGRDGKTGLWISNTDDSNPTQITFDGSDSFPAWSSDGSTIAFSRDEGGNVDIYVVNVDGSNLRRLTNAAGHDSLPTYAPNGDIIFRSTRTGRWGIWKMGGDGSDQTEIIADACVGNDWAFSRMDVLP